MSRRVRTRRRLSSFYACCVAAAGIVLVALAVPRFLAGLTLLPEDPILRHVLDRQPVSDAQLDRLAESRRAALSWHRLGRTGSDLGLALLLRAERKRILLVHRDLEPAREALVAGLARAPVAPHAWLRLSSVERAIAGDTATVASMVEMSILTGPAEREILFPRLFLALAASHRDEGSLRDLLAGQLDWAWRADPGRTVGLVRATGTEDVLRSVVRQRRPHDADFLEVMLATPPPSAPPRPAPPA